MAGKKGRRYKRRPTRLFYALGAWMLLSAILLGAGIGSLIRVESNLRRDASRAASDLSGQGIAVVSFRLEGETDTPAAVVRAGGRTSSEGAVATLTWHGRKDRTVAVFDGTEASILERGAGRSVSTSLPNEPGRCVLHGHRDGAFSFLRNAREGDRITVTTALGDTEYTITKTYVTDPADPEIYTQCDQVQLALVTCYPFTFVGPAPERFVALAEPS